MNIKDSLILSTLLLVCPMNFIGQSFTSDFAWVDENQVSSLVFEDACEGDLTMTLTTSLPHVNATAAFAHVPANASDVSDETIEVSLTFSSPVTNLVWHLVDIDEDVNGDPIEEYLSNVSPFPTEVTGELNAAGNTIDSNLDPGAIENDMAGWLEYTGQTSDQYSFTYHRPGAGYGLLLSSIEFECPCKAAPTVFLDPEIQEFSGTAIQVSDNEIDACIGDAFCLGVAAVNTDPTATVSIDSNVESLLPGASFNAEQGNAATAEICIDATADMVGTTVITLTAGPNECPWFAGDQIEVVLNVSPGVQLLTDDAVICSGDELLVEASGSETFVWTPFDGDLSSIDGSGAQQTLNPEITTSYVVSSPEVNPQCDASDTLTIEVSLIGLDVEVINESCVGGDGEITVNVQGDGGPYTFTWDNLEVTGAVASDLQDGTYLLTVNDASLMDCSIDTLITVTGFQQATAAIDAPVEVCDGTSVDVVFSVEGSAPFELGWSTNGITDTAIGINETFTLTLSPDESVTVCFEDLIDADGCVTLVDSCVTIDVLEQASANFEWVPNPASNAYGQVEFTNLSTGANQFSWDFGAAGTSTVMNPVIDLDEFSTCAFEACLVASYEGQCADSLCHIIPIALDAPLYMPNVFTPNNDGVNELFLPIIADIECIEELTFRVWNRWGEKIFETTTPGVGWNGSCKHGKHYVSDGVYVWEVIYRAAGAAESGRLTGTVSVLR